MNGKLVKTFFDGWTHYYLKDTEGRTIASTNKNYYRKGINKLSFKNCETIEAGHDITKLCEEDFYSEIGDGTTNDENINSMLLKSYIQGGEFVRNLMNKTETFTRDDMYKMFVYGISLKTAIMSKSVEDKPVEDIFDDFIKQFKPKEWDVEIEMEQYVKYVPKSLMTIFPTGGVRPKLDENECLILKRI